MFRGSRGLKMIPNIIIQVDGRKSRLKKLIGESPVFTPVMSHPWCRHIFNEKFLLAFFDVSFWPFLSPFVFFFTSFIRWQARRDETKRDVRPPYMGIRFFGHNSAIFWPMELTNFMVTPETIMYRLVMKSPGLGLFCHFRFFGLSWGFKKGVAP